MAARALLNNAFRGKGRWAAPLVGMSIAAPTIAHCTGSVNLDIYEPEDAESTEYVYIEEEVGPLRQTVSAVRQAVWDTSASIKGVAKSIAEKSNELEGKIRQGAKEIIPAEETVFPGMFIVAAAYMGGVVLAKNRPILQRIMYPVASAGIAAAFCYPKHMREGADAIRDTVKGVVHSAQIPQRIASMTSPTPQKAAPAIPEVKKEKTAVETHASADHSDAHTSSAVSAPVVDVVGGDGNEFVVVDRVQLADAASPSIGEDKGQSRDEDDHMYTTRK
eukprot:Opistho-2@22291